jgi:uncharacterized protein YdeI (YjbR/CyaY-like superfamily)
MTKTTTTKKPAKRSSAPRTEGDAPVVAFGDARAWSDWLSAHHAVSPGVWLKIAKKAGGVASVSYAEAVEAALAWGWIDGQKQRFDDAAWLQRFTPRGPKSVWSKINREKALALIAAGAMHPPGLAAVERARGDGRWDAAYEPASRATVPDDLAAALERIPRAAAFFATIDSANRYAVLWRVQTATKPETRAARIVKLVEMLARRETLHPSRQSG